MVIGRGGFGQCSVWKRKWHTAMTFKDQYPPADWFIEHMRLTECLELVMKFCALTAWEIGNYEDSKFANEYWQRGEPERNSRNSPILGVKCEKNYLLYWIFSNRSSLSRNSVGYQRKSDLWVDDRDIWDSESRASQCLISQVSGLQHWKWIGRFILVQVWLLCLHVYRSCTVEALAEMLLSLHESHKL